MLIFASLIVLTLLMELAARYYEARQVALTHVSTLRETDYTRPPLTVWSLWGGFAATVLTLAAGLFWPIPSVAGLAVLSLFLVFRATLTNLTVMAARQSMPARLRDAIKHPAICEARIGFYFSGVDLIDPWHFHMWETELKATDPNLVLLLREAKHLLNERKRNSTQAILLPDATAIAACAISCPFSLEAVFYANNSINNTAIGHLDF